MTEEEAKTKRCCGPQAAAHATYWRGGADCGETPMLCLASACMAWREVVVTARYSKSNGARVEAGHIVLRDSVEERREVLGGFCGLAGQPQ